MSKQMSTPSSHAQRMRGIAESAQTAIAQHADQQTNMLRVEDSRLSEEVKVLVPKLFDEEWSKSIEEAASSGRRSVDILHGTLGDKLSNYTSRANMIRLYGATLLREHGYTVSEKQEESKDIDLAYATFVWLEVSW